MISNFAGLKDALYDWMDKEFNTDNSFGIIIVFADQNIPKEPNELFAIRLSSFTRIGQHELSAPGVGGAGETQGRISGNIEFTLQVFGYGTNSVEHCDHLRNSLWKITTQADLRANGIAFIDALSPTLDISGLDDSQYEERSQIDLRFRVGLDPTFVDETGCIQIVNAVGTVTPDSGNDITINIGVTDPDSLDMRCPIGQNFVCNKLESASLLPVPTTDTTDSLVFNDDGLTWTGSDSGGWHIEYLNVHPLTTFLESFVVEITVSDLLMPIAGQSTGVHILAGSNASTGILASIQRTDNNDLFVYFGFASFTQFVDWFSTNSFPLKWRMEVTFPGPNTIIKINDIVMHTETGVDLNTDGTGLGFGGLRSGGTLRDFCASSSELAGTPCLG